jgi:hypothetical protein
MISSQQPFTRLHWALWEKQNVLQGHKILSAICFQTKASHRHTSSVQAHRDQRSWGQQTHGVNYWGDFLSSQLVLYWLLLWSYYLPMKTRQIDFVSWHSQADVECELCHMELPRGLIFEGCHRDTHCLQTPQEPYGQEVLVVSGMNTWWKGLTRDTSSKVLWTIVFSTKEQAPCC